MQGHAGRVRKPFKTHGNHMCSGCLQVCRASFAYFRVADFLLPPLFILLALYLRHNGLAETRRNQWSMCTPGHVSTEVNGEWYAVGSPGKTPSHKNSTWVCGPDMRRFLKSPERIMPEEITKPMAPVASHEACGPPSDHEVHICTPYSFCTPWSLWFNDLYLTHWMDLHAPTFGL